MEISDHGYEVLLQYLTPADTAALRLVSRGWQALVDRCLTTLRPFAATSGFLSLSNTPCLVYHSPFQHSSVRHHPLDYGPSYALHGIAGQFTALHTLSVDCASKACGDFEALPLLTHLRRLHLAQFSFADEAFREGLGRCWKLQALHIESQQAVLQVCSLRHIMGLIQLQELVLRPRGYSLVPPDGVDEGLSALGCLTGITQLLLLISVKPGRTSASGEPSSLAAPLPHALPAPGASVATGGAGAHPVYFSAAATLKLSGALSMMKGLKVLKLTGVSVLPPAVTSLTQLIELSLERIGSIDRPAVASLHSLSSLTALTIITAADALEAPDPPDTNHNNNQQQAQPQAQHAGDGAAADDAVAAANPAAAAAGGVSQGLWLPLLELPALQELVLGSAHCSQQLSLTGRVTDSLAGFRGMREQADPADNRGGTGPLPHSRSMLASAGSSSGYSSGSGGGSWHPEMEEGVSAYVCPTGAWSELANVQGLHRMVVMRSWHSAAVTATFPSFAAAVSSFMAWSQLPAVPAAAAAAGSAAAMQGAGLEAAAAAAAAVPTFDWQHLGWCNPSQWPTQPLPAAGASSTASSNTYSMQGSSREAAGGAVGVFYNHPNQGCYVPSLPHLMVLALRPSMQGLGLQQRLLLAQMLQLAGSRQLVAGSQQHLLAQQQGLDGWRSQSDSVARCLLLAQLRSSMHHSKLLLVLGASATALTRLELTVDQSWPPSVLASLGQLERLRNLSVLKLDCGRQQPVEPMWEGLSRLTSLRWLCLRWLDRLPVAYLAPLTNLVALQLKNIDKPPGVAQLAEVLHGMPHLTALAIEGALLDADEDWLRDMAGLMRHGRWTSSWVEHLLCREYRLRVLGSITAALLMSALLNSPKWPEMLMSAFLAAVSGAIFVMAVVASLLQLLFDPRQLLRARNMHRSRPMHRQQRQQQQPQGVQNAGQQQQQQQQPLMGPSSSHGDSAAAQQAATGLISRITSSIWQYVSSCVCGVISMLSSWTCSSLQLWWVREWVEAAVLFWCGFFGPRVPLPSAGISGSTGSTGSTEVGGSSSSGGSSGSSEGSNGQTWLSFMLRVAALRASYAPDNTQQDRPIIDSIKAADRSSMGSSHAADRGPQQQHPTTGHGTEEPAESSGSSSDGSMDELIAAASSRRGSSSITDPGSAFRRLRFLSLRRCTLSHSNNSVSNKLWQLSVLASQLAPGLGAQVVAVSLALVLWPLAVAAAISRIAATSGSFSISSGSSMDGNLGLGTGCSSAGGYTYSRRSRWAAWAWGWDLVCGLLQGAANRVEGAAAGCGPVVAVASCMPELRFLDLTWLNLEPWELHAIVQLRQLHYLGLSRQQVGVVMSREAVFARNCSRRHGRSQRLHNTHAGGSTAAAASAAASEAAGTAVVTGGVQQGGVFQRLRGSLSVIQSVMRWLLVPMVFRWRVMVLLLWWPFRLLAWVFGRPGYGRLQPQARQQQQQQQQQGVNGKYPLGFGGGSGGEVCGVFEELPAMMLIESPSGFDEVVERKVVL